MAATNTSRVVRSGVVVAIGSGLANIIGYAFLILLSRAYPPSEFGQANAILAVGTIATVPALAVQLVVAREVARGHARDELARVSDRVGWFVGAVTAGVVVVTVPLVGPWLNISPLALCWTAAMAVSFTAASSYIGSALGNRLMNRYAIGLVVMAAVRLVTGLVVHATGADPTTMAALVAAGTLVAAALLRTFCVPHDPDAVLVEDSRLGAKAILVVTAGVASFLVLSSTDLLLARATLDSSTSGIYAAGGLFTRIGIWAPQFVAIVVFPLAAAHASRRLLARSMAVVLAIGVVAILVALVIGSTLITTLSGPEYADAGRWVGLFTGFGVLFALMNLMLMTDIARRRRFIAGLIWTAVVMESALVLMWPHPTLVVVLGVASSVALVATVIGTTYTLGGAPSESLTTNA